MVTAPSAKTAPDRLAGRHVFVLVYSLPYHFLCDIRFFASTDLYDKMSPMNWLSCRNNF